MEYDSDTGSYAARRAVEVDNVHSKYDSAAFAYLNAVAPFVLSDLMDEVDRQNGGPVKPVYLDEGSTV